MKKEFIFRIVLAFMVFLLVYQFGVKPIFSKSFIYESSKNNTWAMDSLKSEKGIYDLIVVGSEPEGIAAAVSAARLGAKTLLIAQDKDLGGVIGRSLQFDFGVSKGEKGDPIVGGIFFEFSDKLGSSYSLENYKKTLNNLVNDEKNIDVLFSTDIVSPVIKGNSVTGLIVSTNGIKRTYSGKRFIDATSDGALLMQCKIPYSIGSEDINMKDYFIPSRLNFIMDGVKYAELSKHLNSNDPVVNLIIKKYEPSHINIKINNFKAIDMGNNKILVEGVTACGINPMDADSVAKAYKDASAEAKNFSKYIESGIKELKDAKFVSCADEFYSPEKMHFKGEHVLTVNEVLENTDFKDKIALSSNPVEASKLVNGDENIIGKPSLYTIPLGCIIPLQIDNLFMVGNKISFSSLAASSADAVSTGMAEGEVAGVAAVYSITKGITPREILDKNLPGTITELIRLIKRQGVNLPDFSIKNANSSEQFYTEIKDLLSLGLISGGTENNFYLKSEATEQDFALLLLNGIYRLSPERYSLDLDSRLKNSYTNNRLTKDKVVETLSALYDLNLDPDKAYEKLCEDGSIDQMAKTELSKGKVLTMDFAFHLADLNMKKYVKK